MAHIRHADAEVRRVSSADKLHNARSILADYRVIGDALSIASRRARTRPSGTTARWWTAFRSAGAGRLVLELDLVVTELGRLAEGSKSTASTPPR